MDEFEWDDNKNKENIRTRGIDFEDAISIFLGSTLEAVDDRFCYGEERVISYGELDGRVLVVVYTMRGSVCRVISVRKANRNERAEYYAALAARPPRGQD